MVWLTSLLPLLPALLLEAALVIEGSWKGVVAREVRPIGTAALMAGKAGNRRARRWPKGLELEILGLLREGPPVGAHLGGGGNECAGGH